jgi:type III restriction enzyme
VNSVANALSLRPPQRESLVALDRVLEIAHPNRIDDLKNALRIIQSEYPTLTDFEREFPSLTFALATGVGKTRLMGAFIAYLHLAHGINNFFVLAPGLTVYRKLIADFTLNTSKYVFEGIGAFAANPPNVVTGDNYNQPSAVPTTRLPGVDGDVTINVFNVSKINSEVRGGRAPKIKRLSEYIGQSYFEYLAGLEDLVLLMDESHRYRGSAGARAINELKPILGLELTATPFTEGPRGAVPFKNVIVDYPLGRAIEDGFVKEPAVVTRKDFNPASMTPEQIETLKLEDGIRLHEEIKAELATYAINSGRSRVKPFVLVIARDTTHAAELLKKIESERFFSGAYAGKAIQVDSSKTGAEEDEMIEKLLTVERSENPVEIVIHVNMLKEGWDVTNLYTIIPLRAANARVLIEQSIGRGLRLPYGKRTGVDAVDGLNIVAHDKFKEIVDEANRPGSQVHVKQLIISDESLDRGTRTVVSESNIDAQLGLATSEGSEKPTQKPLFEDKQQQHAARITYEVLKTLQTSPELAPTTSYLRRPEVQAFVVREVRKQLYLGESTLEGLDEPQFVEKIVAKTSELVEQQTIPIPRIIVIPKGDHSGRFVQFSLDTSALRFAPPEEQLWVQYLRTNKQSVVGIAQAGVKEARLEDYVVSALIEFDDVCYDLNSDVLYDLASQVVGHIKSYLPESDVERTIQFHQRAIAANVHAQMMHHYESEVTEHEVKVTRGWQELKKCAFTVGKSEAYRDFRETPDDKSKVLQHVYVGFERCLYSEQKFQSDTERQFSVIVDRDSERWFRPVKGQFSIYYRLGHEVREYQPDFVAETDSEILMIETKMRKELETEEVKTKALAANEWCAHATTYASQHGGKSWRYVLLPHDAIASNMSLLSLSRLRF